MKTYSCVEDLTHRCLMSRVYGLQLEYSIKDCVHIEYRTYDTDYGLNTGPCVMLCENHHLE